MVAIDKSPAAKHWEKLGIRPHYGVNLPLFSIHTANSCGIGEFPDLIPLFPWLQSLGCDVLQLLPLNDTGIDSSPYSAISAFALNPIHLGLRDLPNVTDALLPAILRKPTLSPLVDNTLVRTEKDIFLRSYFEREFASMQKNPEFQAFCHRQTWLTGYALFKALKVATNWQPWRSWPQALAHPTPDEFKDLLREHAREVDYHSFVQFHCFQQMQVVKQHAGNAHIFLKGDVPICCGAESADSWLEPGIFLQGYTAGAPPDMYSKEGQNWGFPVYDWTVLERRHDDWWRQRLAVATELYDLYRIDHIVGLFRIWAVPDGKKAQEGIFLPQDPATWIAHGRRILQMLLNSSSMLPIGEDLGTIPPEVRVCLREMGICGTKVMRWERAWHEDGRYLSINTYPRESMTTVSTHDSETLTLWWAHQSQEARLLAAQKCWIYVVPLSEQYLFEILRDSNHTTSLFHINLLNEYLALFPEMVWPDPKMERINIPGTISNANWSYRLRPSVEEIVNHRELAMLIQRTKT